MNHDFLILTRPVIPFILFCWHAVSTPLSPLFAACEAEAADLGKTLAPYLIRAGYVR
jgi:hypothetical protein